MIWQRITLVLCSCLVFVAIAEQITPIWLSPTNPLNTEPEYQSVRGEWTNITIGVAGRTAAFSTEMDSKGMVWIMGGDGNAIYRMNAVWNYNPKTDLYRWVAGSVSDSLNIYSVLTDYGVPSKDGFPGFMSYSASAIDYSDNIWIYGTMEGATNMFWRFNTTSFEFTNFRISDTIAPLFGEVGVPAPDNYPGSVEGGAALLVDSHNNLWLMGGFRGTTTLNSMWHFNTTSFMWTFVGGDAQDPVKINFANKVWNGRWSPGAIIDADDRVWIFGGYGANPTQSSSDDWGDMWSFDTKTLTWRVEWGNESSFLTNSSLAVPDDYDVNNYPRARTQGFMVDRQDGTLLIGGGYTYTKGVWLNDFWLFNKTSKMWKHVYGSLGDNLVSNEFTHYRAPGSVYGSRANSGRSGGVHNRGNLIACGGLSVEGRLWSYTFSDIWIFPQDQCAGANNDCDVNADCTSTSSATDFFSHTCACKEGYTGDGKTCTLSPSSSEPVGQQGPISSIPSSEPAGGQQGPIRSTPQPSKISEAVTVSISIFVFISAALLGQ